MKGLLVDLDGTLCDDTHRIHLANAREWDEYHSMLIHDHPNWPVVNLVKGLYRGLGCKHLILLTSRPRKYEMLTREWLGKHLPSIVEITTDILMRPDDDWRPSPDMKRVLVLQELPPLICEPFDPKGWIAIDDRQDVLDALAELGILGINPTIPQEIEQ